LENKEFQHKNISDIIKEILERGDKSFIRTIVIDIHPADLAEALTRLNRDESTVVIENLNTEKIAEVLVELDSPIRKEILDRLDRDKLVEIIGAMDSDDATDVIGELEEEVASWILAAMPWKEFREVETLLQHEEDTAGGIMALEIVAVDQESTSEKALEVLRRKADEVEDVFNIYVIDKKGVLKGLVSLKDLVLADPSSRLSEIMEKEPITVHTKMDQEEVANLFRKYDLVAAPVVNEKGRLEGRITVDDVLNVIEEEASEDITLLAGITDEEIGERSIFKMSRVRLPWLLVAFVGEMVSAMVMSRFQKSLNEVIAAAFFIPLIMAMGGNMGIQSSTVIIRGLATGEIHLRDTWQRLLREIFVAFLNGFVIALLLFGVVTLWLSNIYFGMAVCLSLMAVLFNAAFMGTLIPLLLKRIKIDPAIATGPFITTSNDILGLLVYFGIMTFNLHLI
jgi:magnesium transporter